MCFDGFFGHAEIASNHLVAGTAGHGFKHIPLPCGERDLSGHNVAALRRVGLLSPFSGHNPSAFQRGFSITLGADGKIITSASALKVGELLKTKFADGEMTSRVTQP